MAQGGVSALVIRRSGEMAVCGPSARAPQASGTPISQSRGQISSKRGRTSSTSLLGSAGSSADPVHPALSWESRAGY